MKTVLKLVIAVALVNAAVRAADSAWNYYQLKDSAQETLLFGQKLTSQQAHAEIMQTAGMLRLPLKPEDLSVRWRSGRRIATGSYTQQIEFLPNYPYPIVFSFDVDVLAAVGTSPDDEEYPPAYSDSRLR